MSEQKFDYSIFTRPRILYTECQLSPMGTEGASATTSTNDLRTTQDFLIDFICISADGDYLHGGPKHFNSLGYLYLNWQIAGRAPFFPQRLVPAFTMYNWWGGDAGHCPVVTPDVYPFAIYSWQHALRWVYHPGQSFRVDWQKRGSAGGGIPVDVVLGVGLDGVSVRTGHRRIFWSDATIPAGPGGIGAPPQVGSIVQPNAMGNISDEPYLIERFILTFPYDNWAGNDVRWLSWLYIKVVPSHGQPWSDVPVPLALYTLHQTTTRLKVPYKPPGGPILLKAGQAIVFQLENRSPGNHEALVQIGLFGRVASSDGSPC